jgi:co-chaperonin GroES (HSP10)
MFTVDQLVPFRGRIIVEIDLLPEFTPGGIIVPDEARIQTGPNKIATVLKVRPEFTEKTGIREGDQVITSNFVNEVWLDRKPWRICILRESDILCRIVPESDHLRSNDSKTRSTRLAPSCISRALH